MKKFERIQNSREQGFTLIELSIVLVIIGLIVGGVLVGQDMIKAAQIRATISQFEKYDAAVNTFRSKYNGLPGDLSNCTSFFAGTHDCPAGGVAGNSTLEDFSGTHVLFSGEVSAFFHHLYLASLIADPMTDVSTTYQNAALTTALPNVFPAAKLGSANYIVAYTGGSAITYPGMAGVSLYRLTGIASTSAGAAPTLSSNLTPLEAFAIDAKKDDGLPNTGIVQGTDDVTAAHFNLSTDIANTTYGAATCLASVGAYNTAASPTSKICQLVMRTSF